MTLEDETGRVNVILWPGLLTKFRKEALGATLLAVYAIWQAKVKVRHLIASKLVDRSELLGALPTAVRELCRKTLFAPRTVNRKAVFISPDKSLDSGIAPPENKSQCSQLATRSTDEN